MLPAHLAWPVRVNDYKDVQMKKELSIEERSFVPYSGILIWSDLYLILIFALVFYRVLTEPDLLENVYNQPDIYISLF